MGPGTTFRAPFTLRTAVADGGYTDVEIFDANGNFVGSLGADNLVVPTGKTLTVTDANALLVGGKIVPQTFMVTFSQANYGNIGFTAPFACKVVSVNERHKTAEATAGSLTAMLEKVPSGTAIAAGTACLSAGINMKAVADTNQAGALNATAANYTLAAGDSLGILLSGSATELAGSEITVELQHL